MYGQPTPVEVTLDKTMFGAPPKVLRTQIGSTDAMVNIHCTNIDCSKLKLFLGNAEQFGVNISSSDQSLKLTQKDIAQNGAELVIRSSEAGDASKGNIAIVRFLAPSASDLSTSSGLNAVSKQFARCGDIPLHAYDERNNLAFFEVTPDGSMFTRPERPIDENDTIIVQLYDVPDHIEKVRVVRKSATRTFQPRTAGADAGGVKLEAGIDKLPCKEFRLGDFAPGEGQVEISDKTTGAVLGSFTFKVNSLYTGILSFGPTWTGQTSEQSFTVIKKGDKQVIAAAEEGKRSILYTVNYTYFWRGGRDLEKFGSGGDPLSHINPTLGIAMKKTSDHAFAGLSIDAGDFLFTAGVHFAHQTQLSASSGLTPGSEFTGTTADIPTSKRWDSHAYFGVSINLRAASELLKSISGN
jgi:hypothetical protein